MSDENGFVERPIRRGAYRGGADSIANRLRATVDNGKAVAIKNPGSYTTLLKPNGLRVHSQKQPDGTYVAWCERIEQPTP